MVDKIINNIKLPNGEVYAIGGGGRFGLKGDYSTHYGIEYCQHGLIDNPVGTTDIIVKGGMMLCLPGADTKTTIGSDITYSITSLTDVTIFYADGNILEAGEVYYSLNEPADNGIDNYIAWWNPDFGKWQFKSNDTGNVWREAIATPIADIRIEEGNIVRIDYIGYRLLNDDIYGLKNETADIDLSNLTEEGEKHFLNKTQITNCLLEVPQRVKYTLDNGTLTIHSGTVCIVPYGTKDLTETYPVGSTFINDNFKVVDTQFADGKFFVWAEVVSDIVDTSTNGGTVERSVQLEISETYTYVTETINAQSSTEEYTGTDNMTTYRTDLNLVQFKIQGTLKASVGSLPLMRVVANDTSAYGSIDQVFNGLGYIGSTVWVDKGVKGLIPNGRNKDGTLKNIEFTTDKLYMATNNIGSTESVTLSFTLDHVSNGKYYPIVWDMIYSEQNTIPSGSYALWYNVNENAMYSKRPSFDGGVLETKAFTFGKLTFTSGKITSFNPKQPFRAVDQQDVNTIINNSLTECIAVVQTYQNGTSWYRVYSDGWCEQGGQVGGTSVAFLRPFTSLPTVSIGITTISGSNTFNYNTASGMFGNSLTVNGFNCSKLGQYWRACGYIS